MFQDSTSSNNRFAWLTPLPGRSNSNGPWIIAAEHTAERNTSSQPLARKVTSSALLQLVSDVLDVPTEAESKVTSSRWQSPCGRFRVNWHRSESDNTRLFVQRAHDYFAQLELLIDGQQLIVFREPVWPHLQADLAMISDGLSIPCDCLDALEAGALARQEPRQRAAPDNSMASAA